jgi:uncharacterized RDD family membrane protein YckC
MSPSEENRYAAPVADVADVTPGDAPFELAGRWRRFWAQMVDGLIAAPISWALTTMFVLGNPSPNVMDIFFRVQWATLGTLLIMVAIQWIPLARQGQTLGKMALGVRIVRCDGTRATVQRIIGIRYLPFQVLGVLPILGILGLIDILFIFTKERRCIHDRFADTIVIRA